MSHYPCVKEWSLAEASAEYSYDVRCQGVVVLFLSCYNGILIKCPENFKTHLNKHVLSGRPSYCWLAEWNTGWITPAVPEPIVLKYRDNRLVYVSYGGKVILNIKKRKKKKQKVDDGITVEVHRRKIII